MDTYTRGETIIFRASLGFAVNDRASYRVLAEDDTLVASGFGRPESLDTWTATMTVPDSLPCGKYRIVWVLQTDVFNTSETHYFEVISDPIETAEEEITLVLQGGKITNKIIFDLPATSPIYASLISGAAVVAGPILVREVPFGNKYAAEIIFDDLVTDPNGFGGVLWEINGDSIFQQVFVMTQANMRTMTSIRRMLDQAHNYDINRNLIHTDPRIFQGMHDGMGKINAWPPRTTTWTVRDYPAPLENVLVKAACVEILNAYILAEGMSAFDFQGGSTTLTIDRTQYLTALRDALNAELEQMLTTAKKSLLGRSNVLNISKGAYSNIRRH